MKRYYFSALWSTFLSVFAVMCVGVCASYAFAQDGESVSQRDELRILSFNIRLSYGEIGKPTEWKCRKEQVAEVMKAKNYDFIGVQEAIITPKPTLNQVEDLKALLPDYGLKTRSRMVSETEGESTPILWNKARWEIDAEKQGVFWLSDTPDVPESITWENACPRTVVWGKFHELADGKRTGRCVYFFNTHFDHVSEKARQLSAVQITDFITKNTEPDAVVILTGDLNTGVKSPAISYLKGMETVIQGTKMTAPFKMVDTFFEANPGETYIQSFHGYRDMKYNEKIDYVLVRGDLRTKNAEIIRTKKDIYPSDHFPVDAILEW